MIGTARNVLCIAGAAVAVLSCTTTDRHTEMESAEQSHEAMPADDMHAVMRAKLAHTQAIVEGIALRNFGRIERNAEALVDLSERGDWMVHETMAYVTYSDDFRNTARTLARDARQENLARVSDHYADLVRTCVACHDYLRQQRETKDLPGSVSQRALERLQLAMGR